MALTLATAHPLALLTYRHAHTPSALFPPDILFFNIIDKIGCSVFIDPMSSSPPNFNCPMAGLEFE